MKKYAVINPDGTYAGVPCENIDEARELANAKAGRVIAELNPLPIVKHYHCPVNGFDCPYYEDGICGLDDPLADCDDFASLWDEGEEDWCDGGEECATWG